MSYATCLAMLSSSLRCQLQEKLARVTASLNRRSYLTNDQLKASKFL